MGQLSAAAAAGRSLGRALFGQPERYFDDIVITVQEMCKLLAIKH